MDEKDIKRLFLSLVENSEQNTDAIRKVFSILVKSTLKYRDCMLKSRGVVVTVEDVRTSLSWLVPALAIGNMPKTDNEVSLELLKLWLDDLNKESGRDDWI